MTTTNTTSTASDARHILHHFGDPGGVRPGSFTEKLIDAMGSADQSNLAKLEREWPGLVGAYRLAHDDLDGIDQLRQIAGADAC